jgi:hypothetical protein
MAIKTPTHVILAGTGEQPWIQSPTKSVGKVIEWH